MFQTDMEAQLSGAQEKQATGEHFRASIAHLHKGGEYMSVINECSFVKTNS